MNKKLKNKEKHTKIKTLKTKKHIGINLNMSMDLSKQYKNNTKEKTIYPPKQHNT